MQQAMANFGPLFIQSHPFLQSPIGVHTHAMRAHMLSCPLARAWRAWVSLARPALPQLTADVGLAEVLHTLPEST